MFRYTKFTQQISKKIMNSPELSEQVYDYLWSLKKWQKKRPNMIRQQMFEQINIIVYIRSRNKD